MMRTNFLVMIAACTVRLRQHRLFRCTQSLQWTVTVGFFTSASQNLVWKRFKNVVECTEFFQLQLIPVLFLALSTTLPTWTHQTFAISIT